MANFRDGFRKWLTAFELVCKLTGLFDAGIRRHLPEAVLPVYDAYREVCDDLQKALHTYQVGKPNP